MGLIRTVFRKELKDHLRDRRSVTSALAFPIFSPLLFGMLWTLVASWQNSDRPLKVPVVGSERAPNLIAFLVRSGAQVSAAPKDYEQRIKDGDEDMTLIVPEDFARDFARGKPATVRLVEDSTRNKSRQPVERVKRMLELYRSEMGGLRLLARGVSPELAAAVLLDVEDVSTKQQQAANLLNMIPLFLLMGAFVGGMHVAIDTMAGERERGSLEPLMVTPVTRTALVLGKWGTTVLTAAMGVLVSLVGFMVVIRHVPLEDLGVRASLGGHEAAGIALAFLPLLGFTGALQMLIATFARSFKEAQSYLSLVMLVPTLPGMMLSFSPFKTQPWMMAVPTLGQQLLVSEVLRGETFHPGAFAMAAAGALLATAICLVATIRLLGREKIIFGR